MSDNVQKPSAPLHFEEAGDTSAMNNPADELSLKQAIKLYPKVVRYCLAMTTAIILWGYDLVVVGTITAVPAFQQDYGQKQEEGLEYIIPASWLALWSAFGPLGSFLGAITGGWIQDRIGRKKSLIIGSVFSAVSIAIIVVSNQPEAVLQKRIIFLVGKLIQGFAVGIIKIQALTYVSENIPTSLRGPGMALFPAFTLLGQLCGAVVIYGTSKIESDASYMIAFASQWIFSLPPLILGFTMPESPSWLVRKERMTEALKSLDRLLSPKVDPEEALKQLQTSIKAEERLARSVTYRDCFRGTNRRRTWIVIFANFLPSLFGLPLISSASYFMQTVGMAADTSLIFLIAGIVLGMVSNGTSVWMLSKFGRRPLTMVTLAVTTLLWTGMGVAGFWRDSKVTVWFTATTCMTIVVVCGLGVWSTSYAIMGEASALRLRAKSQAIGGVANYLTTIMTNMVLPYVYNPDAGNLGAKTGFVFTGLSAAALVGTYFFVPEMKARSVLELDHMFELKLKAQDFAKWRGHLSADAE